MRAYIKISPPAIPPFVRAQSLSQKKAPSSQKKASARQKRKDQELYLNLYVVQVVFVVPVVVIFFPTLGRLFLRGTSLFLPPHLSVLNLSTDSQSL